MNKEIKVSVIIPETLKDVTLGQYQQFISLEDVKDADIFEIFCNVPRELVNYLPIEVAQKCIDNVHNILLSMRDDHPHVQMWEREGQKYGFIPNLNDISYGEYLDLSQYMGSWDTADRAMSILYRKVTKRLGTKYSIAQYTTKEYDEYNMKDMPLSIAVSAQLFFYALMKDLLKAIPNYISRQEKEGKVQISKEHLLQLGELTDKYTLLHKEMFDVSTRLQNLTSTNV